MDRVEIIARTEQRRKVSETEKAAILAEREESGQPITPFTQRTEITVLPFLPDTLAGRARSGRKAATARLLCTSAGRGL